MDLYVDRWTPGLIKDWASCHTWSLPSPSKISSQCQSLVFLRKGLMWEGSAARKHLLWEPHDPTQTFPLAPSPDLRVLESEEVGTELVRG